ncbi:MAG: hypothetical protein SFY56_15510 [Bacteroidota bacterium]|nr:hypothetical protein [Bacteroidota bacterium]
MRITKNLYFILTLLLFYTSCNIDDHINEAEIRSEQYYHKTLAKIYSPDKRCYLTIEEHGIDSSEANTQVIYTFDMTGGGIYAINGRNKEVKAYWKDNSNIVIETKKEYTVLQSWPKVHSFADSVKVDYVEK